MGCEKAELVYKIGEGIVGRQWLLILGCTNQYMNCENELFVKNFIEMMVFIYLLQYVVP